MTAKACSLPGCTFSVDAFTAHMLNKAQSFARRLHALFHTSRIPVHSDDTF